jgi:N-acetylneuraminic acid mutarotase
MKDHLTFPILPVFLLVFLLHLNSWAGFFAATGDLNYEHDFHTATLLPNGKVLVAGGANDNSTAEIYDPSNGTWTVTGSLNGPRGFHAAALLADGTVLVAGGGCSTGLLASAEIYDPASGLWTPTGSMANPRYNDKATLLSNGKVLVTGGYDTNSASLSSAELYDPTTGTWTNAAPMLNGRSVHTSTLLLDGRVLVAGGYGVGNSLISSELYDPVADTWTSGGLMPNPHGLGAAALLADGKVLVTGGPNNLVTVFNPTNAKWNATNSMTYARYGHTATLLTNGNVLVTGGVGGEGSGPVLNAVEIFNPSTGSWISNSPLIAPRQAHTATLLPNGTVLIAGGYYNTTPKLTELFIDGPRSAVPITLKSAQRVTNTFRFSFESTPGWSFTALVSTNMSLPLSNWAEIGNVMEVSTGKFQFTDPQATNGPQRFYRVRAN